VTLADILPTLAVSLADKVPAHLWPDTTTQDDDLHVAGVRLASVAATFGTPVTVLDETTVRARCRAFRTALPEAEVTYAGKALSCRAVLRWIAEEGLSLDVCSAGELAVARSVNFPASRILVHGNAKTPDDLKAALAYGDVRIVVDSLDEIDHLAALARTRQRVLVRVTPGVDAHTHRAITTGTDDQKFGFSLATGAASEAVRRVLSHPNLELTGLHCHIGSQVRRVASFELAARRMVDLIAGLRRDHGVTIHELDLGGGFAVPYLPEDDPFDLTGYATRLRVALHYECQSHGVPVPKLIIEPGRSIVATAGVTVYRVVTVKRGPTTFVAVDGGLSDNPRPSLYGARYSVRLIGRTSPARRTPMTVVGRHCEAGDVVATDVPLPADIHAGDLLAVPCTGAYHHSLASNYNQVCRPPLIGLHNGTSTVLVRGETEEDLLRRDVG